jgi:hypothetical protein
MLLHKNEFAIPARPVLTRCKLAHGFSHIGIIWQSFFGTSSFGTFGFGTSSGGEHVYGTR